MQLGEERKTFHLFFLSTFILKNLARTLRSSRVSLRAILHSRHNFVLAGGKCDRGWCNISEEASSCKREFVYYANRAVLARLCKCFMHVCVFILGGRSFIRLSIGVAIVICFWPEVRLRGSIFFVGVWMRRDVGIGVYIYFHR